MFEDDRPREVEAEGKTVDEAVRKALIMTGWTREQIAVEVLDRSSGGAWVAGAVARVRVTRKTGDALELARRVTGDILERMGLPGRVQADRRPDHIQVVVQGDGLQEKLVGRDGEPLDALQHLVARIVSKQSGTRQMVSVDLGGYRQRRERELRDMAYELADAVRQTGRPIMTEPMGAAERRVVHLALNEDPDITTFAVGEGLVKAITIAPIDQAPPPEDRLPQERRGQRGPRAREEGTWRPRGPEGRRGPRHERDRGPREPGRGGGRGGSGPGGRRDRGEGRPRDRSGGRNGRDDRGRQEDRERQRQGDRDRDRGGGTGRQGGGAPDRRSGWYRARRGGEWSGGGGSQP